MNLAEWLRRTAGRSPVNAAILKGSTAEMDYAEFARRAASVGAGLQISFGIKPGDRVALLLPNCTEYLPLLYGIWFAGAAAVPVNWKLHARESAWIIGNAGAKVVLTTDEDAQAISKFAEMEGARILALRSADVARLYQNEPMNMPVSREQNDPAWLFYTSGTTGRPKGAMLSHGNLAAMAFSYFADVDEVFECDAALYAAPMSHGAGLYNFMHVVKGARHAIPESGSFDANEVLECGRMLGSVSMFAAPTMVRRLVDAVKQIGSDGDGLRTIVYGGGPMDGSDIEEADGESGV